MKIKKMKYVEMPIPILILSFLPLLMVVLVYGNLPDMVPLQWTNEGIRYGEKWKLIPVSCISILVGVGMPFLAHIDPKKQNYEKFTGAYAGIQIILLLFMICMMFFSILESLYPSHIPINRMVYGIIALISILLGNLMPKIKSNFFMGIKTPWTLSNEAVWNKTHRLGGKLFVFGGVLLFGSIFLLQERFLFWSCMTIVLCESVLSIVMSYVWYRKEVKK